MRHLAVGVLALTATLLLVACGGDGSGGADEPASGAGKAPSRGDERPSGGAEQAPGGEKRPSGRALSKLEYRREANALCRRAERKADALPEPQSPDEIASTFEDVLDLARRYDPRFAALDPPAELTSAHRDLVRENKRRERYLQGLVGKLRASDDQPATLIAALPELRKLIQDSNALARGAGLKDCVGEVPAPGAQPRTSPS